MLSDEIFSICSVEGASPATGLKKSVIITRILENLYKGKDVHT